MSEVSGLTSEVRKLDISTAELHSRLWRLSMMMRFPETDELWRWERVDICTCGGIRAQCLELLLQLGWLEAICWDEGVHAFRLPQSLIRDKGRLRPSCLPYLSTVFDMRHSECLPAVARVEQALRSQVK